MLVLLDTLDPPETFPELELPLESLECDPLAETPAPAEPELDDYGIQLNN